MKAVLEYNATLAVFSPQLAGSPFLTCKRFNVFANGTGKISSTGLSRLPGALSHVYAFLLLMSSKPHNQVELLYIESGLLGFKEKDKST